MWSRIKVQTAPASIAAQIINDVKKHIEVDWSEHNNLITRYIDAAVARIDGPRGIGVALLTQTWRKTLDDFPGDTDPILLPGWPFQSITTVGYVDTGGNPATVDAADYYTDEGDDPVRLVPAVTKHWPPVENLPGVVTIDYVVGYTDVADIPADLMDAIFLYVAHRFANREAVNMGMMMETPIGFTSILNEHNRLHAA